MALRLILPLLDTGKSSSTSTASGTYIGSSSRARKVKISRSPMAFSACIKPHKQHQAAIGLN